MYTLHNYFTECGLKHPVAFAKFIEMEAPPWENQRKNLRRLLVNERWGLFDEPATGKTMAAQAACLYWISEGNKCVCVMPPVLLYQFRDEFFEKFRGADKYVRFEILDEELAKRKAQIETWHATRNGWPEMVAMSYQMFNIEFDNLMKAGYSVLMMDEAQNIKNPESQAWNNARKFAEQPGGAALILMTGTPIHREIPDAYALIKLINPNAYRSFKHFENLHVKKRFIEFKTPRKVGKRILKGIMKTVGYDRYEYLNIRLYEKASRFLKRDIFEIKDPTIIEVPIHLDPDHLSLYKRLLRERILFKLDETIIALNESALRQKALQIVTCPELFVDKLDFENKVVTAVETILDGLDLTKTKVIVFANFRESVKALAKHFDQYNPALMFGESDNDKNRLKFLNDDSCRMLVGNAVSAGVGLNLQGVCHTIIFAEPTGVPGTFKQAMDRVLRFGQKNLVNVYIVKALKTISPRATQSMRMREEEAQRVYQDTHSFVQDFQI